MAGEVFISYAREDERFVRRLHEALVQRNRETWVDWEDIPLTADWWAEIQRGIEAANTFVFIISPDSAQSPVCYKEIDYAATHNKRMVPIVFRPLSDDDDADKLHPAINAHNWIFMRDDDTFDRAFDALIMAMDTDLSFVREHTALLIRARAWEERQREPGLLLRGQPLEDAEAWLAEGQQKAHSRPTDLHVEYITRSRRAQNRRTQRNWIVTGVVTIIAALLVVSLVLYRQAEIERQEANRQRQDAEQSREIARAIGVSARAQLELFGTYPERGVLLALAALEEFDYVFQAERALGTAVQTSRVRAIINVNAPATSAVAWSPGGTMFVTVGENNTASLWDAATGAPLDITLIGHTDAITSLDWSRNGRCIVSGSRDNTARVWDATTGELRDTLAGHGDWVLDVDVTRDCSRLATATADGQVRILSLDRRGQPMTIAIDEFTYVNSVEWSPDETWLVTTEQGGMVRIWEAQRGAQLASWNAHEENTIEAAWSPDGAYIATAGWDETAHIWRVSGFLNVSRASAQGVTPNNAPVLTVSEHVNRLTGVTWSPDGALLLTTSRDRSSIAWDARTGVALYTLSGHTASVNDAAWSPDGTQILTIGDDQQVRLWESVPQNTLLSLDGHTRLLYDVAWSPDGTQLVTVGGDQVALVWDTSEAVPVQQQSALLYQAQDQVPEEPRAYDHERIMLVLEGHQSVIFGAAWSPDGAYIATASRDSTVRIWDAATGDLRDTFAGHEGAVKTVAWSPDGSRIASGCDDNMVLIWEPFTDYGDAYNTVLMLSGHTRPVTSVTWSPDGTLLISGGEDSTARVWNTATGQQVGLIELAAGRVNAAVFAPHGDKPSTPPHLRVALASSEGTASLWTLTPAQDGTLTPRLDWTLAGHLLAVTDVDWSPNGARVVTVSDDRTALVWDAETGVELYTLEGHGDDVEAVDWSPARDQIATASEDTTAKTWRVFETTTALKEYAVQCCAVRPLSRSEREQFNLPPDPSAP